MHITHISFECYPIAKAGGLADVVGALPKYQQNLDHTVDAIVPYYSNSFTDDAELETIHKGSIRFGNEDKEYEVRKVVTPDLGFTVFLIYIEHLLDRKEIYDHPDNEERFLSFQLAAIHWMNTLEQLPDVVHCHDHHTGLIPFMMQYAFDYHRLNRVPTIFTIHNAQYQGQIPYDKLHYLPDFDKNHIGLLDWGSQINPLATGIKCAWRVTTVSPSYMEELQEQASGLEGLLRHEKAKCFGVLNGIDTETWNPETDPMLLKNYKISNVVSGRKEHKNWLCTEFNLDKDLPLFSFIGRLVGEKGADLLPSIIRDTLQHMDVNILILGSGHDEVEYQLNALKEEFAGRYNAYIGYSEKLSHIIYAGTDFLLMPSRVEPCGLNQMYALRYGAIPIVRRTGGLKDTVIDIGEDGFGICHNQAIVWDVCYSIERGAKLYKDQERYRDIQKQIMKIDHSWTQSATEYITIYKTLITQK